MIMARFSPVISVAFLESLHAKLPMETLDSKQFLQGLDQIIKQTGDLSGLLSPSFFLAERNKVAKMTRAAAQEWFQKQSEANSALHCRC